MRVQITRLYDEVALSDDDDLTKIQRWESASLRFYSQSTLRAVTSISVSIKMCYYRLASLLTVWVHIVGVFYV